jgi:hypothetical protein
MESRFGNFEAVLIRSPVALDAAFLKDREDVLREAYRDSRLTSVTLRRRADRGSHNG